MKEQGCEIPARPQAKEGGRRSVRKSPLERKWSVGARGPHFRRRWGMGPRFLGGQRRVCLAGRARSRSANFSDAG